MIFKLTVIFIAILSMLFIAHLFMIWFKLVKWNNQTGFDQKNKKVIQYRRKFIFLALLYFGIIILLVLTTGLLVELFK